MRFLKNLAKVLLALAALVLVVVGGLAAYLTLTEYRPAGVESLTVTPAAVQQSPSVGSRLTVVTFNTGYAGLDRDQDFFMDGGKRVHAHSEETVRDNMAHMLGVLSRQDAQIVLLQELTH